MEQLKAPSQSVKGSTNKESSASAVSGQTINILLPNGTSEQFAEEDRLLMQLLLATYQKHTAIAPSAANLSKPEFERRITAFKEVLQKHGLCVNRLGGKGRGAGRNPFYALSAIKEFALENGKRTEGIPDAAPPEVTQITLPNGQLIDTKDPRIFNILKKLIEAFSKHEKINRTDFGNYSPVQFRELIRKTRLLLKEQSPEFEIINTMKQVPRGGIIRTHNMIVTDLNSSYELSLNQKSEALTSSPAPQSPTG